MSSTDKLVLWLAEGCGLGRLRPAPGTWGSLWGIPIGLLLGYAETTWWQRLLVAVLMFVVGVPICRKGADLRGEKDPSSVVWDEMAAFPIVFAFAPLSGAQAWITIALGFVLFRIFDISKPPPVRQGDRLSGGLGIMIDDTLAAVYAAACLYVIMPFLPF